MPQPSAPPPTGRPSGRPDLGKGAVIGVCVGAAVVAICLVCAFVLPALVGAPGSEGSAQARIAQVTGRDGQVITALARPRLISVQFGTAEDGSPRNGDNAYGLVAPALASYNQGEATAGSGTAGESATPTGGDASDGSATSAGNDTAEGADASEGSAADEGSEAPAGDGSASGRAASPYATLNAFGVAEDLGNVVNIDEFNLEPDALTTLRDNLFVVDASWGYDEYFDLYEMNRYELTPNFVTVDSIMHTYHIYFAHLLKTTESGYLYDKLVAVSQLMLDASTQQAQTLADTEWEDAARRNMVFFGTALKLLQPDASIPESVASDVDAQVALVSDASGTGDNAVTSAPEDYSQYKPRGYYEETEQLQRYFRAMMWYGRTHFLQSFEAPEGADGSALNRCALLMTLAMQGDEANTANADWEAIYAVTSFFAGASDDSGFYEYYPLVVAAYGDGVTVESLPGDTEAWDYFNDLTSRLEPPRISSVIVGDETQVDADDIKGFRFMGQRFSIDESIYQQLVHDMVPDRLLPSALDLPAALGSEEAVEILAEEGKSDYPGYDEQLEKVRADVAASDPETWSESLYASWLYTLNPLLLEKGEGYPTFMASDLWDRKDLQSYLSSYAELKHDTVLYSKQIMAEMGGGEVERDDRGYVEPEAEVYARLADLIRATSEGLSNFGVLGDADRENLAILEDLTGQLETIALKELGGEDLSDEEFELIRSYGGQLEHFWDAANPDYANGGAVKSNSAPAAIVVDIATSTDEGVLEVGTGKVVPIYVIAPVNGDLKVCCGGVPLYYEFVNDSGERLGDSQWREMLGITMGSQPSATAPDPVEWIGAYTRGSSSGS